MDKYERRAMSELMKVMDPGFDKNGFDLGYIHKHEEAITNQCHKLGMYDLVGVVKRLSSRYAAEHT